MKMPKSQGHMNQWVRYGLIIGLPVGVLAIVGFFVLTATRRDTVSVSPNMPQIASPSPLSTPPGAGVPSATPPSNIVPDATIPPVSNGAAPVISRLNTKQPVVFLTIDDGANKQQFEIDLMHQNHLKATLFLANRFIWNDYDFFKGFLPDGSLIEDHSMHHPLMAGMTYDQQKKEICDMADVIQTQYGRRPVLFRPPGGSYNAETPRAAAACGMKAVVMWFAKANGGSMQYQLGHTLRPGDIVLMHFRPEFKQDLGAFLAAEKAANLQTELLEDWLPPTGPTHS